eukprot:6778813-Prymnesium_polylepis.1
MSEVPTATNGISGSPNWDLRNLTEMEEEIGLSEWLPSATYLKERDMLRWYLRALYFAVVNLTDVGKDLVPLAVTPLIFTLLCFIIGVFVFAYLTSAIVTFVMNADPAAVEFRNKEQALLGFMETAHIDAHCISRAQRWLRHWWHMQGGEDLGAVFNQLPPSLCFEVRVEIFKRTTSQNALFDELW